MQLQIICFIDQGSFDLFDQVVSVLNKKEDLQAQIGEQEKQTVNR